MSVERIISNDLLVVPQGNGGILLKFKPDDSTAEVVDVVARSLAAEAKALATQAINDAEAAQTTAESAESTANEALDSAPNMSLLLMGG